MPVPEEAAISIPYENQRPAAADITAAAVVYGLYIASYFVALPVLIGIIIAEPKSWLFG